MTNIVMIARGRDRLTAQAITSIDRNTRLGWASEAAGELANFLVVVDGMDTDVHAVAPGRVILHLKCPLGILGGLRNIGAWYSEKLFGRGDYLLFLDADIAVTDPRWLERMQWALQHLHIVGGQRHPYHGVNEHLIFPPGKWLARADHLVATTEQGYQVTDTVAGYSMMMTWDTYDRFGPFAEREKGVCKSEDHEFCRRVVDAGFKVGYVHPAALAHCGITNSEGNPAVGSELFERVPGLLYE